MLFFVIFILFTALILRLGVVQIVYGDDYRREIERTEDVTVNNSVPRGKMYDRTGKTVVDNTPVDTITYTRLQGTTTEEMLETAEKLAGIIEKSDSKVTERDKKDFWMLLNPDEAKKKITKQDEKEFEDKKIDDKEIYKRQLSRITEQELQSLTKQQLEVLAIYREMASAKALTPQIIKTKTVKNINGTQKLVEEVTEKEVAMVSENLESLPGIEVSADWNRDYKYGKTLASVIGKVSTSGEGIPLEQLDYYLARDYNRNDRVGKSYIEAQYEDVLQGQKAKVKNVTDKSGNVLESALLSAGKRGNDLVLTIDMDLQRAVEEIIEQELRQKKSYGSTQFLDRAFVVMMDPNTGEVLTMAGKRYARNEDTGKMEFTDFALGNITTSYTMGSVVKGATVLTGYETGVLRPGAGVMDSPIKIGPTIKKSWKNMGWINDLTALKQSSNVYMFHIAMDIGKGNYRYGQPLSIDTKAFDTMRYYFNQFGLGTRTGIDLPNESAGFKGQDKLPGKLLDFSIGQFDTYTPMQLAQYVSTIANGGNRLQPHIVKQIREPSEDAKSLGPVTQEISPVVLNTLDMKSSWIERVQTGFRKVMQEQGGTGKSAFAGAKYDPAGKTGTAEAFYDGPLRKNYKEPPPTMNLSLVGYAPSKNPEVAMAVVVPWAYQGKTGHSMNMDIGRKVMDKYFELKEKRDSTSNKATNEDNIE
ncbi:penicillin-binding transpeptidase domain-containing protein [Bacillus massiliigorillae]|uniref:penicillin-binding transpeptidase domain-containing protein n=1 Tax=Bacillus massiliigorillae TaxID=1243664 RepID=UPI0005A6AB51|nr:penicillin-binding transpeptidase domain-containing protein [Bacillus massiliigorillae]